jgi:hypothetical protein
MLIKNTEANLKHIDVSGGSQGGIILSLMAGYNEVEPAAWEKALKSYVVQEWVKSGKIEAGDPKRTARDLSGFDARGAIAVVTETFSETLLLEWQSSEKRGNVLAAIQAQVKLITPDVP